MAPIRDFFFVESKPEMRSIVRMDIKSNIKDERRQFLSNAIQQRLNFKLLRHFKSFGEMEGKFRLSNDIVKPSNDEGYLKA